MKPNGLRRPLKKVKRNKNVLKKARVQKPFTKFWLWTGDRQSEGGMRLIREMGGKRIRPNGGFKYRAAKTIINWGSSQDSGFLQKNTAKAVGLCVNKLKFFQGMPEKVAQWLPVWTDSKKKAQELKAKGLTLMCRTVLNGHSGEGIIVHGSKNKEAIPDAPLYTVYQAKDEEYRVHCCKHGDAIVTIYQQKKVKRADFEGKPNRFIRCFDNGYTYQHNGIDVPAAVTVAAQRVFAATGLDFGAVDVIYVRNRDQGYVLEINTAPGLEGESVKTYAEAFKKYF